MLYILPLACLLLYTTEAIAQPAYDTANCIMRIYGSDTVYIERPRFIAQAPDRYTYLEEAPDAAYKGGIAKYIMKHLHYPADARENNMQGRVYVRAYIRASGMADSMSIARPVYPSLDAEALRVIRSVPKWKPAVKDGKPIDVWWTFPVGFVLE